MTTRTTRTAALLGAALLMTLTACGDDADSSAAPAAPAAPVPAGETPVTGPVAVTASDRSCGLSVQAVFAGPNVLAVTNTGTVATEIYVYGPDDRVVTERPDIAPGERADVTFEVPVGEYEIACKPGQEGDGIRTALSAREGGTATVTDPEQEAAVAAYRAYVQGQADALVPLVEEFAATVKAGDVAAAQALYAPSRVPWEAIEPVAESFGDLDPAIDLREADLEPGQEWTGWHRIEKALWVDGSTDGLDAVADQLVVDIVDLQGRVATADLSASSIGNGAKELLDEVATGKITGEEEAFSHTDLVDVDANVVGAKKAFEVLTPIVSVNNPELTATLTREFADVEAALVPYQRPGGTYVSYDTVTEPQRQELARAVDALGEPLSQLAAEAVR